MFYEEKVIDGVLHYRTSPNGDWRAKTAEQLTEMLETLRDSVREYTSRM